MPRMEVPVCPGAALSVHMVIQVCKRTRQFVSQLARINALVFQNQGSVPATCNLLYIADYRKVSQCFSSLRWYSFIPLNIRTSKR